MTSQLLVHGRSFSHIQFAVKQDQALGHAVLRQVKAGQLPLGRVSFALLLSLVRTVRPRARRAAPRRHLRRGVGESLLLARERHVSAAAPVARGTARSQYTVRTSVTTSFDHIMPSLPTVFDGCLLYTSPSPRDRQKSRMPSSA